MITSQKARTADIAWTTAACLLILAAAICRAECPITLEPVVGGLNKPVGAAVAPGQPDRLYILEQHSGRILILDLTTNTLLPEPFLVVQDIATGFEQGLLGLAFHPDYQENGLFYVNATRPGGGSGNGITMVMEYRRLPDDPNRADPASETVLLFISQPYENHNAGWMAFGPDGYLYIATGDGGSGGDPQNNAQDLGVLLGKILRIDVDGFNAPGGLYGIPADNPFVDTAGARPEIWAYGLRNPWRNSFDRQTGDLWIADVGQSRREEIDFEPAASNGGRNYGWRVMEGTLCYDDSEFEGNPPCFDPSLVDPIYDYGHDVGRSVTGGYVYRGDAVGGLAGTYFFADYGSGRVWSFRYNDQNLTDYQERTGQLQIDGYDLGQISSFAEDANGELYILDIDNEFQRGGEIFRIVSTGATLTGDVTGDCSVDTADVRAFAEWWLIDPCEGEPGCNTYDLNDDGRIDLADFAIISMMWLETL